MNRIQVSSEIIKVFKTLHTAIIPIHSIPQSTPRVTDKPWIVWKCFFKLSGPLKTRASLQNEQVNASIAYWSWNSGRCNSLLYNHSIQWNSDITLPVYNAFPPLTLFPLSPLGKAHKSSVCFSRIKRSSDITLSRFKRSSVWSLQKKKFRI